MRYWLLTNTTYGTWLPGDPRGSVTSVRDLRPREAATEHRFEHDRPGGEFEPFIPGIYRSSQELMNRPAIRLDIEQAEILLSQFQETASHRGWKLHAVAIMANHFHVVIEVGDNPQPRKVLADLKAYGSRSLNRQFGTPASGTWWTTRGSKRKLSDDRALAFAVDYVAYRQEYPLVVWSREVGRIT